VESSSQPPSTPRSTTSTSGSPNGPAAWMPATSNVAVPTAIYGDRSSSSPRPPIRSARNRPPPSVVRNDCASSSQRRSRPASEPSSVAPENASSPSGSSSAIGGMSASKSSVPLKLVRPRNSNRYGTSS